MNHLTLIFAINFSIFDIIFIPPAAGPGPGFYSAFCVVTHVATLLFGSLMSKIGSNEGTQDEVSDKNTIADI